MVFKDVGDFITAISYNKEGNTEYMGKANPGASKDGAVWKITRFVYTGGNLTDIQYADGNLAFDNIWNDRVSLNYS